MSLAPARSASYTVECTSLTIGLESWLIEASDRFSTAPLIDPVLLLPTTAVSSARNVCSCRPM